MRTINALLAAIAIGPALVSAQDTSRRVCTPVIEQRQDVISRNMPYLYYDQGKESIPVMHPAHKMLVERRDGTIGKVQYSLLGFQEAPGDSATLGALVVDWAANLSWHVSAKCDMDIWPAGLLDFMEALASLPKTRAAQPDELAATRALGAAIAAEGPVRLRSSATGERGEAERWVSASQQCFDAATQCASAHHVQLREAFAETLGARLSDQDTSVADRGQRMIYRISSVQLSDSANVRAARVRVLALFGTFTPGSKGGAANGDVSEYYLRKGVDGSWRVVNKIVLVVM